MHNVISPDEYRTVILKKKAPHLFSSRSHHNSRRRYYRHSPLAMSMDASDSFGDTGEDYVRDPSTDSSNASVDTTTPLFNPELVGTGRYEEDFTPSECLDHHSELGNIRIPVRRQYFLPPSLFE
jgi:hypothetical protein